MKYKIMKRTDSQLKSAPINLSVLGSGQGSITTIIDDIKDQNQKEVLLQRGAFFFNWMCGLSDGELIII